MLLSKASREFEEKTRTLYLYYQCLCFLYELHRYKIPDGAHLKPPRPSLQKTFQTCANQSSLRLERQLITSQRTLSHYLFSYPKHFSLKTILFQCLSSTGIFHSSIHSHLTLLARGGQIQVRAC